MMWGHIPNPQFPIHVVTWTYNVRPYPHDHIYMTPCEQHLNVNAFFSTDATRATHAAATRTRKATTGGTRASLAAATAD